MPNQYIRDKIENFINNSNIQKLIINLHKQILKNQGIEKSKDFNKLVISSVLNTDYAFDIQVLNDMKKINMKNVQIQENNGEIRINGKNCAVILKTHENNTRTRAYPEKNDIKNTLDNTKNKDVSLYEVLLNYSLKKHNENKFIIPQAITNILIENGIITDHPLGNKLLGSFLYKTLDSEEFKRFPDIFASTNNAANEQRLAIKQFIKLSNMLIKTITTIDENVKTFDNRMSKLLNDDDIINTELKDNKKFVLMEANKVKIKEITKSIIDNKANIAEVNEKLPIIEKKINDLITERDKASGPDKKKHITENLKSKLYGLQEERKELESKIKKSYEQRKDLDQINLVLAAEVNQTRLKTILITNEYLKKFVAAYMPYGDERVLNTLSSKFNVLKQSAYNNPDFVKYLSSPQALIDVEKMISQLIDYNVTGTPLLQEQDSAIIKNKFNIPKEVLETKKRIEAGKQKQKQQLEAEERKEEQRQKNKKSIKNKNTEEPRTNTKLIKDQEKKEIDKAFHSALDQEECTLKKEDIQKFKELIITPLSISKISHVNLMIIKLAEQISQEHQAESHNFKNKVLSEVINGGHKLDDVLLKNIQKINMKNVEIIEENNCFQIKGHNCDVVIKTKEFDPTKKYPEKDDIKNILDNVEGKDVYLSKVLLDFSMNKYNQFKYITPEKILNNLLRGYISADKLYKNVLADFLYKTLSNQELKDFRNILNMESEPLIKKYNKFVMILLVKIRENRQEIYKQVNSFNQMLEKLNDHIKPVSETSAHNDGKELINNLKTIRKEYIERKINLEQFKVKCSQACDKAMNSTLKDHRGFKGILQAIFSVIAKISDTAKGKLSSSFFKTESFKRVEEMKRTLEDFKNNQEIDTKNKHGGPK